MPLSLRRASLGVFFRWSLSLRLIALFGLAMGVLFVVSFWLFYSLIAKHLYLEHRHLLAELGRTLGQMKVEDLRALAGDEGKSASEASEYFGPLRRYGFCFRDRQGVVGVITPNLAALLTEEAIEALAAGKLSPVSLPGGRRMEFLSEPHPEGSLVVALHVGRIRLFSTGCKITSLPSRGGDGGSGGVGMVAGAGRPCAAA